MLNKSFLTFAVFLALHEIAWGNPAVWLERNLRVNYTEPMTSDSDENLSTSDDYPMKNESRMPWDPSNQPPSRYEPRMPWDPFSEPPSRDEPRMPWDPSNQPPTRDEPRMPWDPFNKPPTRNGPRMPWDPSNQPPTRDEPRMPWDPFRELPSRYGPRMRPRTTKEPDAPIVPLFWDLIEKIRGKIDVRISQINSSVNCIKKILYSATDEAGSEISSIKECLKEELEITVMQNKPFIMRLDRMKMRFARIIGEVVSDFYECIRNSPHFRCMENAFGERLNEFSSMWSEVNDFLDDYWQRGGSPIEGLNRCFVDGLIYGALIEEDIVSGVTECLSGK